MNEMLQRIPENISVEGDLVPGGDLRLKANGWLRSSFKASGLRKVPREPQIRLVVRKVLKKKSFGLSADIIPRCFPLKVLVV